MIVDYERSNFSVSQNNWDGDTTPEIAAIASTTNSTSANNASSSSVDHRKASSSHNLPPGTFAGVGVAAFFLCLIAVTVATFYIIRRRRRRREDQPVEPKVEEILDPYAKAEMDGSGKDPLGELDAPWKPPPEADSSSRVEMPSNDDKSELAGGKCGVEVEGSDVAAELKGDRFSLVEMDAGRHGLSEVPSLSRRTSRSNISSLRKDDTRERPAGRRKPLPKVPTTDREKD